MSEEEQDLKTWMNRHWTTVKGELGAMMAGMWKNLPETLVGMTPAGIDLFKGFFGEVEETAWRNMIEYYISKDMLNAEQANALISFKDLPSPFDVAAFLFINLSLATSYVGLVGESGNNLLRQRFNKDIRPNLPRPEEVLQAAFVAPERSGQVREIFKRSGFKEEDIDLMFLSNYRLYNEEMIRVLYLRGVLSEDEMFMRMRELGYTDTRTKEIIQSWPLIPGPADLFHLVAKEAFEPDMVTKMGLDDEFPVEQVQWLVKQGFSEDWAKKYWYAHWEMPSIQQGFEMLHRGVIDLDTLDLLFRTVEVPPFWRDKLTKIAFMPYTRVDTRRMHDMGVLTTEELVTAYEDQGYDREHALKMAEFTIKYNAAADKDLTKSQILTGYKEKLMSYDEAKTLIVELDYTEDQADYMLAFEDYKYQKELQDDLIDNIRDRYQNRFIEKREARAKLDALNIPAIETDILLDKWEIKVLKDVKLPSKTDLDKFLKNKIIDVDRYKIEMDRLGYNIQYTDWYYQLAKKTGAV